MPYLNDNPDRVAQLLEDAKVIAVVGLTDKEGSDSLPIAKYLQDRAGYTVYPVNPTKDEVMGLKSYPSLKDVPEPIDIVDVFRGSRHLPNIVDEAVEIGAKAVWAQVGIFSDEAKEKALAAGLDYGEDMCLRVQHMFLKAKPSDYGVDG